MAVVHIVLFQFKPDVTLEVMQDVCQRMLDLKDKCIHPTTNKPYIKSSTGGRDCSPEGLQHGMTHAFVVEFENKAHSLHYINEDLAHRTFVKSIEGVVASAQVLDFVPGVFKV
ncbi:MAG: hypothetical protein M1840_008533 [Geoglossum simile]|nr:MAG: hypothetical protein M1840_008533 [Geoglossum simile]